jgi:hypothetical protein
MPSTTPRAAFSTDDRLLSRSDPFGIVECSSCEETAKPEGGVHYHLQGRRVTMVFDLPNGWAVQECSVLCRSCARRSRGTF